MSVKVPVSIQAVSSETRFLPQLFNANEYDTLSSLNLPMNESGTIAPQETKRIPLGYRIVLPRGYIGMMKERRSVIEHSPFLVLAGIIDCNAIMEEPQGETILLEHPEITNNPSSTPQPDRKHPEIILYLYNCGPTPLEYTRGKAIVQLFVKPVCESQLQILAPSLIDCVGVPLRQANPTTNREPLR